MSLRRAINDKCRDCIADELATGSAAVQIELCPSVACPLWPVRPVRAQRIPYSVAVLAEQGLSEEGAAARLAEPKNRAAFGCTTPNRARTARGGAISMENTEGTTT